MATLDSAHVTLRMIDITTDPKHFQNYDCEQYNNNNKLKLLLKEKLFGATYK